MKIKALNTVKRKSTTLNSLSDFSKATSGPNWEKFKKIVKIMFNEEGITEISVNDFHELTGLHKEISRKLLLENNAELFKK